MATTFKVDPNQLKNLAGAYDGSRQKCVTFAKEIMNVANALKGSWQGDAATAFYNKLLAIQGDINDINKRLDEHGKDLLQIAGVYDKADIAIKSQASSLNPDVLTS